ncbi:hypothetical protein SMACR_07660 [Sordaria macrospora]|nr:hypothetical protein SMACR_07660 [Sordaria macrospora]WPJ67435.1 hypothetical protein SMAC4_07660 [Sordaria macrospora]
MSHQNPRYQGRVTVRGPPMPAGLETAAHYVDEQLKRWNDAHKGKYSPTTLKKLEELDDQVQDLYEARLLRGEVNPGDGTKILCILAQLNVMRDCMDEVDDMEKEWVWIETSDTDGLPFGTANDQPVDMVKGLPLDMAKGPTEDTAKSPAEDLAKAPAQDTPKDPPQDAAKGLPQDSAKGTPLDTDTDGEYVIVDENEEEDVNGRKDLGEQGVLATLQKYLKALKVH